LEPLLKKILKISLMLQVKKTKFCLVTLIHRKLEIILELQQQSNLFFSKSLMRKEMIWKETLKVKTYLSLSLTTKTQMSFSLTKKPLTLFSKKDLQLSSCSPMKLKQVWMPSKSSINLQLNTRPLLSSHFPNQMMDLVISQNLLNIWVLTKMFYQP